MTLVEVVVADWRKHTYRVAAYNTQSLDILDADDIVWDAETGLLEWATWNFPCDGSIDQILVYANVPDEDGNISPWVGWMPYFMMFLRGDTLTFYANGEVAPDGLTSDSSLDFEPMRM